MLQAQQKLAMPLPSSDQTDIPPKRGIGDRGEEESRGKNKKVLLSSFALEISH